MQIGDEGKAVVLSSLNRPAKVKAPVTPEKVEATVEAPGVLTPA